MFFRRIFSLRPDPGHVADGPGAVAPESTFTKYRQIPNSRGLTGAQAAEEVMRSAGVYDVSIEAIPGDFTDHFDPRARVLRLWSRSTTAVRSRRSAWRRTRRGTRCSSVWVTCR